MTAASKKYSTDKQNQTLDYIQIETFVTVSLSSVDVVSTEKPSPQQQQKIKLLKVLECRVQIHSNNLYDKLFYE